MKRRWFLSGAAGLLALGWFRSSEEDAIVAVLRKRLDYLRLEHRGVLLFARDFREQHIVSPRRLRMVSLFEPVYVRIDPGGRNLLTGLLRNGEERIASSFLLSSDFFANGSDESRMVRYLGLYNALQGCANPFARRV